MSEWDGLVALFILSGIGTLAWLLIALLIDPYGTHGRHR